MSEQLRKLTARFSLDSTEFIDGIEQTKKRTKSLTVSTKEGLEEYERVFGKVGTAIKGSNKDVENHITQVRKIDQEARKANRTYDSLVKELTTVNKMISMTSQEQQIFAAQMRLGEGATEAQKNEITRLITEQNRLQQSLGKTTHNFRMARNGASQFQFQLQDIIVQSQMGTNWSTIITQQGSQIAALFGTGGAVFGTVLAFTSMFAGTYISTLMDGKDATDDLTKSTNELKEAMKGVDVTTRAVATAKAIRDFGDEWINLNKQIDENAQKQKLIQEELNSVVVGTQASESTLRSLTAQYEALGEENDKLTEKQRKLNEAIDELSTLELPDMETYQDTLQNIGSVIDALEKEAEAYTKTGFELFLYEKGLTDIEPRYRKQIELAYESVEASKREEEAIKRMFKEMEKQQKEFVKELDLRDKRQAKITTMVEQLQLEAKHYGDTALAMDLYRAKQLGASESDLEAIRSSHKVIQTKKNEEEANERLSKSYADFYKNRAKEAEALARLEEELEQGKLSIARDSFNNLAQLAEEGSALAKVAFLGQQGVAAAEVIINTEAAKARAYKDFGTIGATPAITLLELQRAMSLATIAGTTIAGVMHGGGVVPEADAPMGNHEQTYLLQGGEYVESRAERRQIDKLLAGGNRQPVSVKLDYNISVLDNRDLKQVLMQNNKTVYQAVDAAMRKQLGKRLT